MTYVAFGKGEQPLIILPGLSDGLKTVHGQSFNLAFYFRKLTPHFRVYVFSRINNLKASYSMKEMARDQALALQCLGLNNVYLMGVSQGGMIAQQLAIDYPEVIAKLILVVSASKTTPTMEKTICYWIKLAEEKKYSVLMKDTMEKTYSLKTLRRYRPFFPIITRVGKTENFDRFLIQAQACLSHDVSAQLNKIVCPTLVIGGDSDKVIGEAASEDIAENIPSSKLIIYPGLGHGAYEEEKSFFPDVIEFMKK
nr:alpha/beta hydrolase [Enterococcus sp. 665A]